MTESSLNLIGEIIVGTNEEFIISYKLESDKDGSLTLDLSFTNHSHNGRIKQLAIHESYLASGGTDEMINIFNLKNRCEVGAISAHSGTITCLDFHRSRFLFSGSEDGNIHIQKGPQWQVQRVLKAHKGGVKSFAVHPSGKLGLSLGKNKALITWDLMKGRKAFNLKLKNEGDIVMWSPQGLHYIVASMAMLDVYLVENGSVIYSLDFKKPIYCCCFLTDDLLVIGGEKKTLCLYDISLKKMITEWEAHETRTKSITKIGAYLQNTLLFASSSSDGFIKVWQINLSCLDNAPSLKAMVNCKCRIICMAFFDTSSSSAKKEREPDNRTSAKKRKRSNRDS